MPHPGLRKKLDSEIFLMSNRIYQGQPQGENPYRRKGYAFLAVVSKGFIAPNRLDVPTVLDQHVPHDETIEWSSVLASSFSLDPYTLVCVGSNEAIHREAL